MDIWRTHEIADTLYLEAADMICDATYVVQARWYRGRMEAHTAAKLATWTFGDLPQVRATAAALIGMAALARQEKLVLDRWLDDAEREAAADRAEARGAA